MLTGRPILFRLEKDMKPTSEATKLEGKDQFHEYRAANKLEGAKAFITGGEYVSPNQVIMASDREHQ